MLIYISTDSGSWGQAWEFDSLADALDDFGCPSRVVDESSFVAWLDRCGGYGFIEIDGDVVAEVSQ